MDDIIHFPAITIEFQSVRNHTTVLTKRFDYSKKEDRRALGEACRQAFMAGNTVVTRPISR